MSTSTILALILGLALLGNTIVGGLPDKVIALGAKASTGPATGPSGLSTTPTSTGGGITSPADTVPIPAVPTAAPATTPGMAPIGTQSIAGSTGISPLNGAPGSGQ